MVTETPLNSIQDGPKMSVGGFWDSLRRQKS